MISIYNKHYERIAILSNEAEGGIHFYDDELTTTIPSGVYTFEFKVPKTTPQVSALAGGNYIELRTIHGKQLLLTISDISETRLEKTIYCEDSTINALNSFVDATEPNASPQGIDYYLNHTLEKTNYIIGTVEADTTLVLGFSSTQRILERLQEIATAFEVELAFDIEFSPNEPPKRYVHLLKTRTEDDDGFRVSSDELVYGIERNIEMNIATKMVVRGGEFEPEVVDEEVEPTPEEVQEVKDTVVEKAIAEAHRLGKTGLRYQWGGNGNPSYDCSGFVQRCYQVAGVTISHRATTYTMWAQQAPFERISYDKLKRGDLIMYDTGYVHTKPNHVGIYLGGGISSPNSVIHTGDPIGITQRADSMAIIGYVRVKH